ncbi:MAG: hypothetical protein ACTSPG_02825 [Candidatus Hodarchaeales archaeon]
MEIDEMLKIDPVDVENKIIDYIKSVIVPRETKGFLVHYKNSIETIIAVNLASKVVGRKNIKLLVTRGKFSPKQPHKEVAIETINKYLDLPIENIVTVNSENILREVRTVYSDRSEIRTGLIFSDVLPVLNYNLSYYLLKKMAKDEMTERTFSAPEKRPISSREKFIQKSIAYYKSQNRIGALLAFLLAETENLSVIGAINKTERLLGHFTKFGTYHAADFLPLADLYRTQVLQVAEHLNIIQFLSTKSKSLDKSSYDYIFNLQVEKVDQVLVRLENDFSEEKIVTELNISKDIVKKIAHHYRVSKYARTVPLIPRIE